VNEQCGLSVIFLVMILNGMGENYMYLYFCNEFLSGMGIMHEA